MPHQHVAPEEIEHVVRGMRQELPSLLLERAAIVKRIGTIKRTVAGLADVFGDNVSSGKLRDFFAKRTARCGSRSRPGLTGTCRRILMESFEPVTTHQVWDRNQTTNPSVLARHRRPATSLAVILRRLVSYGEVGDRLNEKNVPTWLWIGPRKFEAVENPSMVPERMQHKQLTISAGVKD
jgi:hypothetical protein